MPKYRKLHVKVTESLDVNDMPDDFTRLLWVLLPLALCRDGRGIDNAAWIKAKIFPLREDLNGEIDAAMDWYDSHNMIIRYQVDGRRYFCLPKFHLYQGNTSKEAESNYPPCPEQLLTNSGQGLHRLNIESESIFESESESESTPQVFESLQTAFINATGIPDFGMHPRAIQAGRRMVEAGVTPDDIHQAVEELGENYTIVNLASVETAAYNIVRRRTGKKKKVKTGKQYIGGEFADSIDH